MTTISKSAIDTLLPRLVAISLTSAPSTHLPISLPLAFPTPLHTLNIITLLHILNHTLSNPSHSTYFSQKNTTPLETALRGLIGLYLASDESWGAANYLSTKYLRTGGLNEEKIGEFFGVEVMREREHETIKGVRVGERWEPGAKVCEGLIRVFEGLGMMSGRCVGEEVGRVVDDCRIGDADGEGWAETFARRFCDEVVVFIPSMGSTSRLENSIAPASLYLLQDMAHRQSEFNDLDLHLPSPEQLADISPLPLALAPLIYLGIIDIDAQTLVEEKQLSAMVTSWKESQVDIFVADTINSTSQSITSKVIEVRQDTLDRLLTAAMEACGDLRDATRAGKTARGEDPGITTYLDVFRAFKLLDDNMEKLGLGLALQVG